MRQRFAHRACAAPAAPPGFGAPSAPPPAAASAASAPGCRPRPGPRPVPGSASGTHRRPTSEAVLLYAWWRFPTLSRLRDALRRTVVLVLQGVHLWQVLTVKKKNQNQERRRLAPQWLHWRSSAGRTCGSRGPGRSRPACRWGSSRSSRPWPSPRTPAVHTHE